MTSLLANPAVPCATCVLNALDRRYSSAHRIKNSHMDSGKSSQVHWHGSRCRFGVCRMVLPCRQVLPATGLSRCMTVRMITWTPQVLLP
jgi:hypothetical protein